MREQLGHHCAKSQMLTIVLTRLMNIREILFFFFKCFDIIHGVLYVIQNLIKVKKNTLASTAVI